MKNDNQSLGRTDPIGGDNVWRVDYSVRERKVATLQARLPYTVMQYVITAVGPDNRGLADPIVHCVTELGANIAEIQMFDHDQESVFSMLTRVELDSTVVERLTASMDEISQRTGLSIRTWSPKIEGRRPRLAICRSEELV